MVHTTTFIIFLDSKLNECENIKARQKIRYCHIAAKKELFHNYVTPWGRRVYTFFVILRDGKVRG